MTPEQQRAITIAKARLRLQKQKELETQEAPVEKSWWDTFSSNVGRDVDNVASSVTDYVANTDAGQVVPDVAKLAVDTGDNLGALLNGVLGSAARRVGVPDSMLDLEDISKAESVAGDVVNTIRHPIDKLRDEPLGMVTDTLGLALGGYGAIPKALKAGKLADETQVLNHAKSVKDAEYGKMKAVPPGTYDAPNLKQLTLDLQREAVAEGFDAILHKNIADALAYAKKQTIAAARKGKPKSLAQMDQMRQNIRDMARTPAEGRIADKLIETFDKHIRATDPVDADLLDAAHGANITYKNTQGILDMLEKGRIRSLVSGTEASKVKQGIATLLNSKKQRMGYPEDIKDRLETVLTDTPNTTDLVKGITKKMGSRAAGGILGALFGPPGAAAGYGIGSLVDRISSARGVTRANKIAREGILDLVRDMNNLPNKKKRRKLKVPRAVGAVPFLMDENDEQVPAGSGGFGR